MTFDVALPALDGRDHLAFLAALGTTRLIPGARLSFDTDTYTAVIHSQHSTLHEVIGAVRAVVTGMDDDVLIPGVPSGFPEPSRRTGGDPMRVERSQFPQFARKHDDPSKTEWIASLVTDLATDEKGRVMLSLLQAPAGKQAMETMFAKALEHLTKDPSHLTRAYTGWKRVPGFTGEYFDHRAQSNAADNPTGESMMMGAPGPTWLALMALPCFTVTSVNGRRPDTTGWHRPHRYRPGVFAWPLWRQPLTPRAITTLIEHPKITITVHDTKKTTDLTTPSDVLTELGIFYVGAASRRKLDGGKSAGVLAPHTLRHRPPEKRVTATIL